LAQRESELRRRSILDTVPDAIVVIDARGTIQSFSPAAERLFGYDSAEVVDRNNNALMPTPYREAHDGYIERDPAISERRIIGIGRVVTGLRNNGEIFPMELQVGEFAFADSHFFTGFVRDLTERQEAERRIQDLQAELLHASRLSVMGQMASTMAHELNQPLTAVMNYLEAGRQLLATGMVGPARVAEVMAIAAWQVRPPRLLTIATAVFITGSQSGLVASATNTSPGWRAVRSRASAITRTFPDAIFSRTARPVASTALVRRPQARCAGGGWSGRRGRAPGERVRRCATPSRARFRIRRFAFGGLQGAYIALRIGAV
jgi:PAS domain S-box-containing protein